MMQTALHTHRMLTRSALVLAAIMVLGVCVQSTQADPLLFSNVRAFQNNNTTTVDLFSNPGVTLFGPKINFSVDVSGLLPPGGADTLQLTYLEAGSAPIVQSFAIPLFGTVQPPFTLFFSVTSPGATPQGVAATLTVDLLNSSPDFIIPSGPNQSQRVNSYSYAFNVAQPVPEPATLLAFSSGLVALVARRRRAKR